MEEKKKELTTISFTLPSSLRIKENARRVISLRFEHPEWTAKQIATEVGLTEGRVSVILNNPRVLEALPAIARQKMSGLVPKAAKAYEQLVDQNENLQVKEKAASRILSNKQVFDAPKVVVESKITFLSVRELQENVQNAANIPISDAVDAEIVPNTTQDTIQP